MVDGDDHDGERSQRVPEDRRDSCGPDVEHVLGLRDRGSRDWLLKRHRERDSDGEPRVGERDRCRPAAADEKERSGSEKRGCQQSPAEVVHAKSGIAPARSSAPGKGTRGHGVRGEGGRPGRQLRRTAIAKSAHEIARETEGHERGGKREKGVHDAGL